VTRYLKKIGWASARIFFILYIGLSIISLIGGFITAPLMTWYFYGDWRFWRFLSSAPGLFVHTLRLLRLMLRDNRAFMFSVPLTSSPRSSPHPSSASLQRFWSHGDSCGDCSNCCRPGGHACPLLDEKSGLCQGYDSFYWRYFNCGRFPSVPAEIEYYDCRKWEVGPVPSITIPAGVLDFTPHSRSMSEIQFESMKTGEASGSPPPSNKPSLHARASIRLS
jgi:hypothetical protein